MSALVQAWRALWRHPLRSLLSVLGIGVAGAMLLDMLMLSGGLERSFRDLTNARGYAIRVTPAGTLPFDTEAAIEDAAGMLDTLRRDRGVARAGGVLATALRARHGDSLVSLVGHGIEPEAQGLYTLLAGADLRAGDTSGVMVSEPSAAALGLVVGDTLVVLGSPDPQLGDARDRATLVVRGVVRFLYDARDQRSVATVLPRMQALAGPRGADRVSLAMAALAPGADGDSVAARLEALLPRVEASSLDELAAHFEQRMIYFRQLAYILATLSLVVTVLLTATLLTITVNERRGEIAALRAIGVRRLHVLRQVLAEGLLLTLLGVGVGLALGLATARYLDGILTDFPGLPAAFSFFVPRADAIVLGALVLLASGLLAGLWPAWLAARRPIATALREDEP